MKRNRNYDRSFKEQAVKLSYERSSVKELAEELGIHPDRIYSWRKEFAIYGNASFSGHGKERLSDEQRELKNIKKQLKRKELELEILKKAIAVFSKIEE
ncbi:MAG: transposase [Rikenellaceae bacterium]